MLALLGGLALLAGAGRPTAAIAALPLCLALPLAFRRKASAGEATVALLLALGLSIIAGTELIYLRDFLAGGDWYRMNTLFKFSVPAWLFLALAGGVMLPVVWAAAGRAPPGSGRRFASCWGSCWREGWSSWWPVSRPAWMTVSPARGRRLARWMARPT